MLVFYELCTVIWAWKHSEKVNMLLDKMLQKVLKRITFCRTEEGANDLWASASISLLSPLISKVSQAQTIERQGSTAQHPQGKERECVYTNEGEKKEEKEREGGGGSLQKQKG